MASNQRPAQAGMDRNPSIPIEIHWFIDRVESDDFDAWGRDEIEEGDSIDSYISNRVKRSKLAVNRVTCYAGNVRVPISVDKPVRDVPAITRRINGRDVRVRWLDVFASTVQEMHG